MFCFQKDKYISMVKDEDKDGLFDQERQTESRRCCLLALSILFALMTVIAIAYGVIYVVCGQFKPSSTPGPPPPCQDQCVYVFLCSEFIDYLYTKSSCMLFGILCNPDVIHSVRNGSRLGYRG